MSDQSERFLRHNAFARRLQVSPSYLSKLRDQGRAVRDESTGRYDLQHPVNHALVVASASTKAPEPTPEAIDDDELLQLQREKLRFERDRVREQAERYALQNARARGEVVPLEMVRAIFGEMHGAVKTYLLTVPNRVARGNVEMRDEMEEALREGIEKWVEISKAAFRQWAEEYYDLSEGDEDDNDDASD